MPELISDKDLVIQRMASVRGIPFLWAQGILYLHCEIYLDVV